MIAHVIDDLFDHHFISSLEEELLDNVGFFTTNIANKKSFPNEAENAVRKTYSGTSTGKRWSVNDRVKHS